MSKIIAVNAGPRSGWNTDRLIKEVARGAADAGYDIEYIDLYRLEKYTGCISCFGCKKKETFGKCILRDGLYDVLEKIRNADGLVIGSPNYLGNLTSSFRALYERLVFQYLTYNRENICCNKRRIKVLLVMTSNCAEEMYEKTGYKEMLDDYRKTFSAFVGPTEVFCCGDTLQVEDYSIYDWTIFDSEEKKKRHDETFSEYLKEAYRLGMSWGRDGL